MLAAKVLANGKSNQPVQNPDRLDDELGEVLRPQALSPRPSAARYCTSKVLIASPPARVVKPR
jgi:hypothetical protein